MPTAGAQLLAAALAAMGSLEVAVRSEVKGLSGGASNPALKEPVPYEIDPSASLAIEDDRRFDIRLGFSSRILFLAVPGGSYAAHYGTGSASGTWRPDDRLRLDLSGTMSQGVLETTPTAQLPASTTPGTETPLQTAPSLGTARQQAQSLYAGSTYRASSSVTLGAAAGYAHSGGMTEEARQFIPEQESERVEATLSTGVSERDSLTVRTGYRRTAVIYFGTGDILDLGVRWDRRIAPGVAGYAGVGAAVTVRSSLVGEIPLPLFPGRVAPELEAGIGTPVGRPDLSASIGVAFAPTVEPYSRSIQNRATARAELDWVASERMRVNGRLLGASMLDDFLPRGGSAVSELVVWFRAPDLEIGVGSRAGFNEAAGAGYWQWSLFFAGRQTSRAVL
jgi:hypothetical protein